MCKEYYPLIFCSFSLQLIMPLSNEQALARIPPGLWQAQSYDAPIRLLSKKGTLQLADCKTEWYYCPEKNQEISKPKKTVQAQNF